MKSLATGFTNRDYNWTGVKTLWVYSIPTVPLSNYGRHDAVLGAATSGNVGVSRYGALTDLQDTAQELTVTQDKGFTFIIDKGDKMDSMNVRDAGKALKREIDEVIVPTEDKYVFQKIAESAKPQTAQGAIRPLRRSRRWFEDLALRVPVGGGAIRTQPHNDCARGETLFCPGGVWR